MLPESDDTFDLLEKSGPSGTQEVKHHRLLHCRFETINPINIADPVIVDIGNDDGRKLPFQNSPTGLCACTQLAFYQPYFNVDTTDVKERIIATLRFYKTEPTFLNLIGDTPDLYGPFWTASTLIFVISVSANLARSAHGYDYDFKLVTNCVSLIYGYLVVAPAVLFGAAKYFLQIPSLGFMRLVCLVGYSLSLYVPCALVATVWVLSWPAIIAGCLASTVFIWNSLKPVMQPKHEKAVTVMVIFLVMQIIVMLSIKFQFYNQSSTMALPVAAQISSIPSA